MISEEINLKLLKLFFDFKLKPSDFMNIYKKIKDLKTTANYFLKKKNKNSMLFDDDIYRSKNIYENLNSLIKYIDKNAISILNISCKEYPALLKEIYFPPPLLFCKGNNVSRNDNIKIAIVGTRDCSEYGKEVAAYLSAQLSKIGFTIVSGMAIGIDKTAHQEAIKEKGGSIGVLGTGIDIKYPYENKYLYEKIIENGGIITEFLPGIPPLKSNFPARNRIISGMSAGVIVIEAKEKSGAIITARSAIKENREVFAVPGDIFSEKSKGCHALIKTGAKLTESVDDILVELENYIKNPLYSKSIDFNKIENNRIENNRSFKLSHSSNDKLEPGFLNEKNTQFTDCGNLKKFPDEDYLKVYNCLGYRSKSLEEIMINSGLDVKKTIQVITFFQLNNIAKEVNFNNFVKVGGI